ncbi:MAG: BMP family ABC transporter substrate-binding protein [Erysipelotrichaceae bacterium]|nr:BMP family ABC transporter substrate-binding protein [Erysipelotrichaceae bacterium]
MKKLLTAALSAMMALSLTACGSSTPASDKEDEAPAEEAAVETNGKIGVILVGDENEGYTAAHIEGINKAAADLGIAPENIMWKYMIEENQACADAAEDLVDQGATLVISNSYGHQTYMQQVAADHSDVTFISMTGDTAANSGLANFKNAFNQTYQSRYVSGIVGGMKLAELVANGEVSPEKTPEAYTADGDIKIGYVGAFPYAEVVSGFTAFYLGVKAIVPNVHMIVEYTSSWADQVAEGTTAEKLIADGCVIISQHADTTGAPSAIQAANDSGKPVYSVGYNVSMLEVAPKAALTSASNDWSVYYNYAFKQWLDGKAMDIPADWSEGYETGAVNITALGESCAEGTDAKVAEVEAAIKDGSLNVFDVTTFTVGGKALTEEDGCDLDFDGTADIFPVSNGAFHESDTKNGMRSAPYFSFIIDGIDSNTNN